LNRRPRVRKIKSGAKVPAQLEEFPIAIFPVDFGCPSNRSTDLGASLNAWAIVIDGMDDQTII